ncbi:zinc ribbon domain-containing protein [Longimicrobium sp.]|uniref:zinc ribbon domain-containing protein n=1 Tax=Longimicrobium sp. TaxID=2029185 RepID=UPI003B3B32DC
MDALDRLYRRVSLALARDPGRALTVGDLYQEVVPYRLIRSELGFAELAEYEHALLRLLAGEREYLETERPEVADEFRRELQAPNPILGIYRDYADVGVQPNPFAPQPGDLTAPPPVVVAAPAPASPPRLELPVPVDRTDPGAAAEPAVPARPRPKPCPGCRSPLPTDREARFCPFCGTCLVPVPCADCSAMMQPEWSFCATCGAPRQTGVTPPAPRPEQRLR